MRCVSLCCISLHSPFRVAADSVLAEAEAESRGKASHGPSVASGMFAHAHSHFPYTQHANTFLLQPRPAARTLNHYSLHVFIHRNNVRSVVFPALLFGGDVVPSFIPSSVCINDGNSARQLLTSPHFAHVLAGIEFWGRMLAVSLAVSREEVSKLKEDRKQKDDKRHLYLAKEGCESLGSLLDWELGGELG